MDLRRCEFYLRHYKFCDEWMRSQGWRGLASIQNIIENLEQSVLSPSDLNIDPETDYIDEDGNSAFVPDDDDDSDEIDPDYLKALAITRQHQAERERQRRQTEDNWIQYIDISQTETYGAKSKAPTANESENPIETNFQDYRDLFHRGSDREKLQQYRRIYRTVNTERIRKIIDMENQLRFNFEQYSDRYRPSFWPVIPIKITWAEPDSSAT